MLEKRASNFGLPAQKSDMIWAVLVVMSMASDHSVYLRNPIKRPLLSNAAMAARALMNTAPLDSSRINTRAVPPLMNA
eukprot:1148804-Lingulodinium_polyedra.AAC.1